MVGPTHRASLNAFLPTTVLFWKKTDTQDMRFCTRLRPGQDQHGCWNSHKHRLVFFVIDGGSFCSFEFLLLDLRFCHSFDLCSFSCSIGYSEFVPLWGLPYSSHQIHWMLFIMKSAVALGAQGLDSAPPWFALNFLHSVRALFNMCKTGHYVKVRWSSGGCGDVWMFSVFWPELQILRSSAVWSHKSANSVG